MIIIKWCFNKNFSFQVTTAICLICVYYTRQLVMYPKLSHLLLGLSVFIVLFSLGIRLMLYVINSFGFRIWLFLIITCNISSFVNKFIGRLRKFKEKRLKELLNLQTKIKLKPSCQAFIVICLFKYMVFVNQQLGENIKKWYLQILLFELCLFQPSYYVLFCYMCITKFEWI